MTSLRLSVRDTAARSHIASLLLEAGYSVSLGGPEDCGGPADVLFDEKSLTPELGLLSERERDVAALLVQGITRNKEIASLLGIREATAKVHSKNILRKLGVTSRAAAAVVLSQAMRGA